MLKIEHKKETKPKKHKTKQKQYSILHPIVIVLKNTVLTYEWWGG